MKFNNTMKTLIVSGALLLSFNAHAASHTANIDNGSTIQEDVAPISTTLELECDNGYSMWIDFDENIENVDGGENGTYPEEGSYECCRWSIDGNVVWEYEA